MISRSNLSGRTTLDNQNDLLKRIADLEHKLEVLVENRVGILEDIEEIKRLQRMYGYYIDLCLWQPMADLFAEKGAAIEIGSRGRYTGKDNVLKFLRDVNGSGVSGLRRLQVINHMQGQGIVTVSPDRVNAQGRWRGVVQAGGGPQRQTIPGSAPPTPANGAGPPGSLTGGAMMYAEGVYENTYVRENGVWKIAVLFWVPTYYVSHDYEYMWFQSAAASTEIPPQRPPTPPLDALGRQFMPFHYLHPITGAAVTEVVAKDNR
jgi:SnoaL-like domain